MKKNTIKMKGLNTPALFVFMHGFFDGRLKAAKIDQDNNLLNSAYIVGKTALFQKYCVERIDFLETEISAICYEMENLLMDLENMTDTSGQTEGKTMMHSKQEMPKNLEEAMTAREKARMQETQEQIIAEEQNAKKAREEKKRELVQSLIQKREWLLNKESRCYNDMEAACFALKERFCIYGHGVLLRPMPKGSLPKLEYERVFNRYNEKHDKLKKRINKVLENKEH